MNGEPVWYWLLIPAALLVGLFFLFVFSQLIRARANEDRAEELEVRHHNLAHAREMELQEILWGAHDARGSERAALMEHYKQKAAEYKRLDDAEILAIVNAQTVIDEQTARELRDGVNPYVKPKQSRAAKLRAARARR